MINTKVDYRKATQAVNFFAKKSINNKINKMKVLKLIWAADRFHIRKYGRSVIGDKYIAMKFGPVASKVKDILDSTILLEKDETKYSSEFLKKVDSYTIASKADTDLDMFSVSDLEALEFAWKEFGHLDTFDLSRLTHEYPEWKKYQEQLESGKSDWEMITYIDFFKNPTNIKNDKFDLSEEYLEESKEIFKENALLNTLI